MAANRIGRVIYLDAPGTYNALYDAKEFVDLEMVVVLAGTDTTPTTLTLYASTVATDDTKNIGQFAVAGARSSLPALQHWILLGLLLPPVPALCCAL